MRNILCILGILRICPKSVSGYHNWSTQLDVIICFNCGKLKSDYDR